MTKTELSTLLPASRFVRLGVLSTIVSYSVFVLGGLFIPPFVAHAIGFALGLIISVSGLGWVFARSVTLRQLALYGFLYLVIFSLGQMLVLALGPTSLGELLAASAVLLLLGSILAFVGGRAISKLL